MKKNAGTKRRTPWNRAIVASSIPGLPFILLLSLLFPFSSLHAGDAQTRNVDLVWVLSPEPDVAGYRIHYGPISRYDGQFDAYPHMIDLGPGEYAVTEQTGQYEIMDLPSDQTLWFSVTVYDATNNESGFSNEKKLPKDNQAPITPCQAIPSSFHGNSTRALLPGWILFFLGVPLWILALRNRVLCLSSR